ncbi:MAG: 50S ribosomal protein L19 [Candidatus Portnoybacteria bacterium CG10_big_fil_rev_8_21_14_0_10_40_22]|uniref:Large ribosomal subunit protein bL19 n=2 Tax=Candidatus Portnoyibacteriota TaxID=1817913 RepID=A0A2M8KG99_9BACT|nr:MAG: 50S ribosomal protein L19 [Candidatus Portnoybacteria bacterium CG_4_10_14_0_2_um_filter_39_11]PJE58956.1 MAG: 50S ribosomal protein L19 [Candidatus Portnoybacteria bacterium CG10_big_fil_rev_8_21_14_0_10_40_22]
MATKNQKTNQITQKPAVAKTALKKQIQSSRGKYPDVQPGCLIRVYQKVREGKKERLQAFEGLVIARKHGSEPGATITVRREAGGFGVERVYPLHSPFIEKIEIVRRSKVRRAKLYYLRKRAGRKMRLKEKIVLGGIQKASEAQSVAEETQDSEK